MSEAFQAALRPRVFHFEGCCPDALAASQASNALNSNEQEADDVLHTRRVVASRPSSSGRAVHRPTKLSQARAVTARYRRDHREVAQGWPAKQPWVAASWTRRVRMQTLRGMPCFLHPKPLQSLRSEWMRVPASSLCR